MKPTVRFLGLTAAVLFAGALGVASGYAAANSGRQAQATIEHTCSAVDKKFIRVAAMNMTSVGMLGREYLAGGTDAETVLAEVELAATRIKSVKPTDPVLSQTRLIMSAMLREYGGAIDAHANEGDAGSFVYRAYGLANFAHDLLATARPHLLKRGCDVSGLL